MLSVSKAFRLHVAGMFFFDIFTLDKLPPSSTGNPSGVIGGIFL